jgi:transcriptional regulatory protein RtcR
MRTLTPRGRITRAIVDEENERLHRQWNSGKSDPYWHLLVELLGMDTVSHVDRFDRALLADVVRVCRGVRSLSAAGRELFSASRAKKVSSNDADRLKKYLDRFGLSWSKLATRQPASH